MLLFHVLIALVSLVASTLTAYRPTKKKLAMSYAASAGTLISGVLLTLIESVAIARICVSGGMYLAAVVVLTLVAHRKLVSALLY